MDLDDIGRLAFRRIQDVEGIEVVAINDLTDAKMLAHLFKNMTHNSRPFQTVQLKFTKVHSTLTARNQKF